ncbi:MAG TPA: molecular chaperone DnaK, partial [Verrucomicrobiae bacterium]|nr:molecular chaperone DnaK [Verrucomicrobiae bacterium]
IKATQRGVAQYGTEIALEQRQKIEQSLTALEEVLSSENSQLAAGDLQRLQAEHAALDEATKPLADVMMDKAMEAMLRKRGLIQ